MMNNRINVLLWIGLLGTLAFGIRFTTDVYRVVWGDHSIWWTPQEMRLPIDETRNNFEMYIGGKLLQRHLSEGTLFSVDKHGEQYRIVSKDISVRLNNWDKVKALILRNASIGGFALGVTITLFLIGLIKVTIQKKKPCKKPAG